ncbi:restriction endonuclease subunit S [Clostridium perfringens]|uniref:Putative type I restriction-modification enzyme, S subunit, EcoA family n=1 Tax=Clostridium perfringens E str. JGS1987 TaxID=451755 RepID=B1BVR8_CLOPF|nr:restriction endonuclease subunit S [Clostridium perfringens]EDT14200.1 putative type I restriction-modification enzyme, S subunit, EcoA family [Clostridium perfringens E str. JGS1987]ELC8333146.1 restriction endonuclease subunit S [Clostridium perfringens]MDK0554301.1 restriction endonuclease subunit S [Clostridium perfringens]
MNNNVPKLRFKEFSDEWEEKKLGSIGEFFKGSGISKSDLSESGKECILYGELYTTYGEVITSIRSKTDISLKNAVLSKINDVIIPSSGETAVDIATASCVMKDNVLLGGDLNVFRPNKDNGLFISYQLNNAKKKEIAKIAQGASVVHIYNEQLKKVKVDTPSLQEQEKIANFFSILDELIEEQEGKVKDLELYKKGMMQKIFKQEIRFKDDNGLDYPEWEEKKITEIFNITRGQVIAKTSISPIKIDRSIYPVYSSQTSNYGILGYDSSYDFDGEFLTWTTDGANAGKVFKRNGKFRCTNVCGLLVEKDITKGFANEFIKEILEKETPKHVSYIGNPKLMNGVIGDIKIRIPLLEEQRKIADFLSNIDKIVEEEKKNLADLREMKKSLLQQMFV